MLRHQYSTKPGSHILDDIVIAEINDEEAGVEDDDDKEIARLHAR